MSRLRRSVGPLATLVCILLLPAISIAQSMKIERCSYARIEELRIELLNALVHADESVRRAVAEVCGRVPSGNPFEDLGRALAAARGLDGDAEFLMRAGMLTLALPEVLDPDAIDSLHVTMHTPRVVPEVDAVRFGIALRSRTHATVVRDAAIRYRTAPEDLLRFRATTAVPIEGLPDGGYQVAVDLRLGDAEARPGDVRPGAEVFVLRGYKARADALPLVLDGSPARIEHASRVTLAIPERRRDPDSHAILTAAMWQVERAYSGDPASFGADPIAELERAEAILGNLLADRPALQGLSGRMTIGFPIVDSDGEREVGLLELDLPDLEQQGPLPLLVLVPGAPTWDRDAARPSSLRTASPGWLAAQFRLGRGATIAARDHEFFVASIESVGRFANGPQAIGSAVRFLKRILPVRDGAVVLLGERESAFAVSRVALAEPRAISGIVLALGAAVSKDELRALGSVRVMVVTAEGHASAPSLAWLADQPGVVGLEPRGVAWPIAVGLRAPDIAEFVAVQTGVLGATQELDDAVESGFTLLAYPHDRAARAFALAQWLRGAGVAGARVRRRPDGEGFLVVVAVAQDEGEAVRSRLASLTPPAFEARFATAVASLGAPAPIDR